MVYSIFDLTNMYFLVVIMLPGINTYKQNCKWSNENCGTDADCCSERCTKLHDGTQPRCQKSLLKMPCFFSYQCDDGLSCGDVYLCCSPFWGVCSQPIDCCEADHVCREEDGYTYKRCLPPSEGERNVLSTYLLILITAHAILNVICLAKTVHHT